MCLSPSPAQTPVAIVLVNWNGWRECIECIDSVLAQTHQSFHLFIVDNDSQDHSMERIAAWCTAPAADPAWRRQAGVDRYTDRSPGAAVPYRVVDRVDVMAPIAAGCRVTLVRSGGNLGFAGGCNVAIRVAGLGGYSHFWFLNPDTVVERGALAELLAHMNGSLDMGIVGSTLLFYDTPDLVYALGGGRLDRRNGYGVHVGQGSSLSAVTMDGAAVERELTWVCGASMLVSTPFIRKIGVMQEDYFLYYEEADWAMRGSRQDYRLGFAPKSLVFHKSGANSSKIMPLFTAGFYYRSRLRFVSRFWPDRMAAAKRKLFLEMLGHLARRRWAAARLVAATLLWKPEAH
jgi:GT2 family glycosyltransferase